MDLTSHLIAYCFSYGRIKKCSTTNTSLQSYSEIYVRGYCTAWIYEKLPQQLNLKNFKNLKYEIDICSCIKSSNNNFYCNFWQCGGSTEENLNVNSTNVTACVCREESDSSFFCQKWDCIQGKSSEKNGTQIISYQQYECTNSAKNFCITWEGQSKTHNKNRDIKCTCKKSDNSQNLISIYKINNKSFSNVQNEKYNQNSIQNIYNNSSSNVQNQNQTNLIQIYKNSLKNQNQNQTENSFCQQWKCDYQDYHRDYEPRFVLAVVAAILNAFFFLSVGFCAADEYPRMFFSRLMILVTVGSVCIEICTVSAGLLGCFIGLGSVFVGINIYVALFFIMPLKV